MNRVHIYVVVLTIEYWHPGWPAPQIQSVHACALSIYMPSTSVATVAASVEWNRRTLCRRHRYWTGRWSEYDIPVSASASRRVNEWNSVPTRIVSTYVDVGQTAPASMHQANWQIKLKKRHACHAMPAGDDSANWQTERCLRCLAKLPKEMWTLVRAVSAAGVVCSASMGEHWEDSSSTPPLELLDTWPDSC